MNKAVIFSICLFFVTLILYIGDSEDNDDAIVIEQNGDTISNQNNETNVIVDDTNNTVDETDNTVNETNNTEEKEVVRGCMNSTANNYNANATEEDNTCDYDLDDDGVLDADEISGCTDIYSKTYNSEATDDDGTCQYFQPENKSELKTAVDEWIANSTDANETYGHIKVWDTSLITDMSSLFYDKTTFNEDISEWDVSNVSDMSRMFNNAESFNQDISEWDVSSVTDMHNMYDSAYNFNQDISGWDVSSVSDMNNMFYYAESFNQDISGWDVSNVTNFYAMFDSINDLSDSNKCAIDLSFSPNENWEYDWDEYCSDD